MEKNTNYPKYKILLESLNFDENEVEKYFNVLTKDLKNESFSLTEKRDQEIEKLYNEFDRVYNSFSDIKVNYLKQYFKNFEELNEEFNKDILALKTEYMNKTNVLLDSIEKEKEVEQKIKVRLLLEYYSAKKPIQDKIDDINKKLDVEYNEHSKVIFDAKESILRNEEFYLNADYHINELNELINFFNELSTFNKDLNSPVELETLSSSERKIGIYLDYLKEQKEKIKSSFAYLKKYDDIRNNVKKINDQILDRKIVLDNELYNCLKEIDLKIDSLNKEIPIIKEQYEKLIVDELELTKRRELTKKRDTILKTINNEINSLKIEKSIEKTLLNKELGILDTFNNNLNKTDLLLYKNYKDAIISNENIIEKTFDNLIELLNDEYNNLNELKEDAISTKEIIHYFNKRYQNLEMSKRIEILTIFRDFLNNNVKDNRELDVYAFEILTSEELLALKKIDLKKKYLTIDLDLEIKEIKYDYETKEIDALKNVNISMKNSVNSLELLKKDFEIDFNIKRKELKNKIQMLDYEKTLDLLSTDYMIAYKRLDNISKIAQVKSDFDLRKSDIETTLKLENIIELSLLDAITKKKEFTYLINKYDSELKDILSDKEQKLRYMNNVLEIERNKFEEERKSLHIITDDLKKLIYPSIIKKKDEANKIIGILKKEYLKDKEYLIDYNKNNENNLLSINDKIEKIKFNYYKTNEYIESLELENIIPSDVIKNIKKSYIYLYKKFSSILYSFRLSNLDLKGLDITKDLSTFYKRIKKLKSVNKLLLLKSDLTYFIDNNYNQLYKNFTKEISKVKYLTDRQIERLKIKADNDHQDNIACVIIKNFFDQEKNFKTLDEIKKSKVTVNKEFEKEISEYKDSYIKTIDFIKKEYESKYDNIMELKNDIIETNTNLEYTLDTKITNSSIDIKNSNIINKKEILDFSSSSTQSCKKKIDELEKEFKFKKESANIKEKEYKEINENYRNKKAIEAKEYFKEISDLNNDNINLIENEIKKRIENKDNYLNKLREKTISFKKDYSKLNKDLENQYNDLKINNTIDYSKKYDEFSSNIITFYSDIEKPIAELNNEVSTTIIDSINKADRLEELLSDKINKSLNDINECLKENMDLLDIDEGGKK